MVAGCSGTAWATGRIVGERHVGGDLLSAFLDDELDDDRALEVARHAADCEPCLQELEALRATRTALRRLPDLQAPVLTGEVRAGSGMVRTLSRRVRWASAVVVVVSALVGAAYLVGDEDGVVPPAELFLVDHVARTGGGPVPAPVGTPVR